ncbi:MAG TPA: ATP synthase F1 subunit delta [Gemmataceae bacterium]|jgi:F-type H+-transporting ATPase subunit delta|nr:ATP synthase F1 subunit delta [Gemmataceae bacterium]
MAEVFETDSRAGAEGSSERRVARVYAEALLDVASERGIADEIGQELDSLVREVFNGAPEVEATLGSPVVKRSVKTPLLATVFKDKVSELLFNFLNVLNSKDRLSLVRNVAAGYRDLLDQRAKRLRVRVKSAVPLTDGQTEQLKQTIGQATGLDPVVSAQIDPALLGGMIVQVGDQVFDSSVSYQIESIRNQLLARSSYEVQTGRDRFSSAG